MNESEIKIFEIPIEDIYLDNDFNCRGRIAPIDVVDLAKSIDDIGLQQPILIQPYDKVPGKKYRIVAGHRRFVACVILKKKTIPSRIVEGLSELEARKYNLCENLKRKDLNMLQEALALIPFKNAGWTQDDVSREIGQSRGWVQVRFYVLDLPDDIKMEVAAGFLTQEQVRDVHSLPGAKQHEAVRMIKERKERGEKKVKILPVKRNPLAKKERIQAEIFELQEVIRLTLGNNLATRVLGWAAGIVSDFEIHRDIREEAEKIGKKYQLPDMMKL